MKYLISRDRAVATTINIVGFPCSEELFSMIMDGMCASDHSSEYLVKQIDDGNKGIEVFCLKETFFAIMDDLRAAGHEIKISSS